MFVDLSVAVRVLTFITIGEDNFFFAYHLHLKDVGHT